jgi:hypothetical protein
MNYTKRFVLMALVGFVGAGAVSAQGWGRRNGFPVRMAVYEKYGLSYDREKGAYCYDNKVVGFFVDEQGRGRVFLSPGGEVHVTVLRDAEGNITGLARLSAAEYDEILEEIDAAQLAVNERMETVRENMARRVEEMREHMKRRLDASGPAVRPPRSGR